MNQPLLFSKVPLETLVVQFDSLGWSYGPAGGDMRVACSAKQAFRLIWAIKWAVRFCAMPTNLKNI